MKHFFAVSLLVLTSLLGLGIAKGGASREAVAAPQTGRAPVIVELFTSEGCSSCPPADALLKKLEEQQPIGKAEVIALEEHVDYWNNGGWSDPFSSVEMTYRQEQYAASFRTNGPYTPQMIVDGHAEFVGSNSRQAQQEIEEAAGRDKAEILLTANSPAAERSEQFNVRVGKLGGATAGDTAEVWMAITETRLQSSVTGGENSGENLRHAAVVRRLHKIGEAKTAGEFSFAGDFTAKLDSNWKRENLRAVVFVQEKKSRRILGATSIDAGR
jgi:hypothetical protein